MAICRCPVCGKQFDAELSSAMPFCGNRCRRIDLHRWLGEKYSVPVTPSDESDGQEQDFSTPDEAGND